MGKLTSSSFLIQKPWINFLVFGGYLPERACVNLVIDGKVVRSASGSESGLFGGSDRGLFGRETTVWMAWRSLNVSDLIGQSAAIEIVDQHRGLWGQINIDHIIQSSQKLEWPRIPGRGQQIPAVNVAGRWIDLDRNIFLIEQSEDKLTVSAKKNAGADTAWPKSEWAHLKVIQLELEQGRRVGSLRPDSNRIVWDDGGIWTKMA